MNVHVSGVGGTGHEYAVTTAQVKGLDRWSRWWDRGARGGVTGGDTVREVPLQGSEEVVAHGRHCKVVVSESLAWLGTDCRTLRVVVIQGAGQEEMKNLLDLASGLRTLEDCTAVDIELVPDDPVL